MYVYICRMDCAIIRSLLDLSQFPCGQDWVQEEASSATSGAIVQGERIRENYSEARINP